LSQPLPGPSTKSTTTTTTTSKLLNRKHGIYEYDSSNACGNTYFSTRRGRRP
jgi:hypothetical protein